MAQSDWSTLTGGLTPDNVKRGVTAGVSPPAGGGTYAFGMRAVENVPGAVGLFCTQTDFSPMAKGGRITGALRRTSIGAASGFAPFLFFNAGGSAASSVAYILGLSDENPCHIQLRKGAIADGLAAVSLVDPDTNPNVLMRSTDTFLADTWQHLRLDVIKQGTDDVILQVYRNDLLVHNVDSPVWVLVPGMEGASYPTFIGFVDDALGVNTGTTPLGGGRAGFAARFETSNRAVYFDHVAVDRQL
jgi:hypothetical protein